MRKIRYKNRKNTTRRVWGHGRSFCYETMGHVQSAMRLSLKAVSFCIGRLFARECGANLHPRRILLLYFFSDGLTTGFEAHEPRQISLLFNLPPTYFPHPRSVFLFTSFRTLILKKILVGFEDSTFFCRFFISFCLSSILSTDDFVPSDTSRWLLPDELKDFFFLLRHRQRDTHRERQRGLRAFFVTDIV